MDTHTYEGSSYLLERMEPIEAISHLIHSRVFELLGYITILKREEDCEELKKYVGRLEEISEKLIHEFHDYLEFYHIGDTPLKLNFK